MKIPVRMISIATSVFWIFLIVFSVSAVYSIKDVQFSFGEFQIELAVDNEAVLSVPVTIVNRGYYDLGSFGVSSEILDWNDSIIVRGYTFIPVIKKDETVNATHTVRLNLTSLLQIYQSLLFTDCDLRVNETVSMMAAKLIPVQASANRSLHWGAPLCNFTLGAPEVVTYNASHSRAIVPMSFENHAFFDLMATLQVHMYSNEDVFIGGGEAIVEVTSCSQYNGKIDLYVPLESASRSGHFEVFFETSVFNYGPLVIPFGG
jgi:hypothetical protein